MTDGIDEIVSNKPGTTTCFFDMSASSIEDSTRNLRSAASVASYECSDLDTFHEKLSRRLKAVIAASKKSEKVSRQHEGWNHHQTSFIQNILYSGVPWAELLTDYWRRNRHSRENVMTMTTSPLHEMITSLLNPCIVAPSLTSTISKVFFRVLVEVDLFSKSVSENPLLQALKRLLMTRPSTTIEKAWIRYIQTNVRLQRDSIDSFNVERAHRIVSVCKHLTDVANGTVLVKCLLTLVQNIDDVDVTLLQKRRKKRRKESYSCLCNKTSRKRRKGTPMFDLDSDMTDELNASSGLIVATVPVSGGGLVERISRASLEQSYESFQECNICRVRKSSQGITQLPIQLVLLRSRVCKKILAIFGESCARRTKLELQNSRRVPANHSALLPIVYAACQHPESPSLRVCMLLLADSLSTRGYQDVVECLWRLYEQRESIVGDAVLRIYSEILVECSHYDDSGRFWNALQPLLNHVTSFCESASLTTEPDSQRSIRIRSVLRCLSCILCHRRNFFSSSADPKWQQVVSKLALAFEGEDWWFSSDMSFSERQETLATLQAVGILGFVMDHYEQGEKRVDQCNDWPFAQVKCIRSAVRRMGPEIGRDGLLSTAVRTKRVEPSKAALCRKKKRYECTAGTPIMDYMSDDLLRTIFSFLGYKRLVKVSGVCKTWNSVSQSDLLWRQSYVTRFNVRQAGEIVDASMIESKMSMGCWKKVFVNKVLAERALRFKRHSSGWKYRTCEHIGCLMVLRSPNQMVTHYRTHKKGKRKQQRKKDTNSKSKSSSSKTHKKGIEKQSK